MSNKRDRIMDKRNIKIKLTDGSLISGKINLRSEYAEGEADSYNHDYSSYAGVFHKRVSDFFTKGKTAFIVVFDASIGNNNEKGVFIINKINIVWIIPEDNP